MTCTQPVHLFVECGLLTDGQVLIKAGLSLLCHSVLDAGGGLDLWAHGARWEQPGVVTEQRLQNFILNFDGAATPHCFPSQLGSIFSQGFCAQLVFSGEVGSKRCSAVGTPVSLVKARLFWGCMRQSDVTEAERFLSQLGRERREPSTSIPTLGAPVPWEGWNPMLAGAGNTHVQLT